MHLSPQGAAPHRPDRPETLAVSPAYRLPVAPAGLALGGHRERDQEGQGKKPVSAQIMEARCPAFGLQLAKANRGRSNE
jgi:hypothetical protein